MAAISSPQIEQYKQHRLNEGARPATVNRELEKLRRAFTVAVISNENDLREAVRKLDAAAGVS